LIFPHVGLSSMPFWSKYTDPPTSMICGFKKEHMLSRYAKIPPEIYCKKTNVTTYSSTHVNV